MVDAEAAPVASAAKPNRRGRTLVAGVFVAFAIVFTVLSTANAVTALYGKTSPSAPLETSCAVGLRQLTVAVDRALTHGAAVVGAGGGSPSDAFSAALAPEWNDISPVEARCSATRDGINAFAATVRYKTGAEAAVRRSAGDVLPLRSAVDTYIPAQ